jgi:GTPase SAR1 family protein
MAARNMHSTQKNHRQFSQSAPSAPSAQPKTKLKCLVLGASSAGKTSLLRRYFYGNFEGNRVPTLGSDWYTKRLIVNPLAERNNNDREHGDDHGTAISLQLWDTPGRERLDAKRPGGQQQQQVPSLQASFLEQADAYLLVYDVTSSTSFKQLLKWYADLVQLLQSADDCKTNCKQTSPPKLPILIVGTKMDLLQRGGYHANGEQQSGLRERRCVLGLRDRNWKGKSYQYEYQVSKVEHFEDDKLKQVKAGPGDKRMEIASYLADRENWTTDWGYLDSLLSSEDCSHPDRDMVKIWCGRNELKHMEASAATGQGVDEAIQALITLAMMTKRQREEAAQQQSPADTAPLPSETIFKYNKTLDLHQRYAPKDERCCILRWIWPCRR